MQVVKYIPDRLYGFAAEAGSDKEVFFHLGSFDPRWPEARTDQVGPPPILGEEVVVTLATASQQETTRPPRAARVQRSNVPLSLSGPVEAFDSQRGYGFVRGTDGVVYHLHRCEMVDGHIPLEGDTVQFYAGMRNGKPRACHCKVVR